MRSRFEHLFGLKLLLLGLGQLAPLLAELLADFAEGHARVRLHNGGAGLLREVHVRGEGLLGRVGVFR